MERRVPTDPEPFDLNPGSTDTSSLSPLRLCASAREKNETSDRKDIVRWVPSRMPDVKVLASKTLRDRIVEKLREGLRLQCIGNAPNRVARGWLTSSPHTIWHAGPHQAVQRRYLISVGALSTGCG
jgi:hypothetical protein